MSEDVRDHPDYEAGYEAAWYGRGAKTGSSAYIAGGEYIYQAAMKARQMFEEAGFTRGPGGVYSKRGTIGRSEP